MRLQLPGCDVRHRLEDLLQICTTQVGEDGSVEVAKAAEALRDAVLEIEKTLLVSDLRCDWETYNYGVRLLGKLTALAADVSLGDYRPTDVVDEVFSDVQTRIDEQIASFEGLVADDLPVFNARLVEAKLDAVLAL